MYTCFVLLPVGKVRLGGPRSFGGARENEYRGSYECHVLKDAVLTARIGATATGTPMSESVRVGFGQARPRQGLRWLQSGLREVHPSEPQGAIAQRPRCHESEQEKT